MKHLFARGLALLLAAALMLCAVATAEEAVEFVEPVDEIVEEQSADIAGEDEIGEDAVATYSAESYATAPSGMLYAPAGEVDIDASFPDTYFRQVVRKYDTDNSGGLSAAEIASVTELILYDPIADLTGIKYFTSLTKLQTSTRVTVTALDVSGMASLKELLLSGTSLTSLNASNCASLEEIDHWDGELAWADVSNCTALKKLNLSNDKLTSGSLNISNCPSMEDLEVGPNQLTTLDVSKMPNLVYLGCDGNKLTKLDLSNNPKLAYLWCENNGIKKLDISNNPKLVSATKKLKHAVKGTVQTYGTDSWASTGEGYMSLDKGVTLVTKSSGKVTTKKSKATAYVGTPMQLELNGLTGSGFKSSNKKVATVNSKGLITPKKAGKTTISYKVVNTKYVVTLTVKDLTVPKSVALNLKGTVAAKVGETQTLTATMNSGAVSKLKWTTSNKKIATVKNGVVKFKKNGTVTITVTTVKGNKKAKVKFKVSK